MAALYTNNASTLLLSAITASDTTLTVAAGQGSQFPNPTGNDYFMATIQSIVNSNREIVKCTGRSGDVLTIVRAQEGTTASAFAANSVIELRVTAGEMTAINPVGSLMMWPTATPPTDWLICNGTAISRTGYPSLYAVIGTTFGIGDGSTTFNLPDYRNRMAIGSGTTSALAGTGGSNDAIVVSHTHTGTTNGQSADHSHTTAFGGFLTPGGGSGSYVGGGSGSSLTNTNGVSNDHNHSFTTASSGSSGTNANLPPYLGINFIIKV